MCLDRTTSRWRGKGGGGTLRADLLEKFPIQEPEELLEPYGKYEREPVVLLASIRPNPPDKRGRRSASEHDKGCAKEED